jgi:hypothetical protein
MANPGFLILSHQLLSMVEPLAVELERRGIDCYVLASKSAREPQTNWLNRVRQVDVVDRYALQRADVEQHLQLLSSKVSLLGCLSVWDGYRDLMAWANRQLVAIDITEEVVDTLRDKLTMRRRLRDAGLSGVQAWELDAARVEAMTERHRYFIKPRTGLASFGTFRADRLQSMDELENVWQRACQDQSYAGVFAGTSEFMLEQWVDGIECSFEVSVTDCMPTVHAVHEKVDLEQRDLTVLENACICPPAALSETQVWQGCDYVARCLEALDVDTGIYHVEARCDEQGRWELIEINPRVGGACILDSTRHHSGIDMLARWIDLIVGKPHVHHSVPKRNTFFRVFFGEPGRKIDRVRTNSADAVLLSDKLFVREGETLPQVDREIFIGQALWDVTSLPRESLSHLVQQSVSHFVVEYAA